MRIIIVGGGTAGWMTAAYLAKNKISNDITVIEPTDIPRIGVGESVTPHVARFFEEIGIPTQDWMKKTGAVYKYANKFVNWVNNKGEYEYFSFNYTVPEINFLKDITQNVSYESFSDTTDIRSIDHMAWHCKNGFDRFDRYFNPQFYYMEKNTLPFYKGEHLLNQPYSVSQHINAEMAAEYIRDEIAIRLGVQRIIGQVIEVVHKDSTIVELKVKNNLMHEIGTVHGDFFIDCSGFHRVLVNKLGWKVKEYSQHLIDSAVVAQSDYEDKQKELVCYTQSIAEPYGWRFKIGLQHRMGNGYCYSSQHLDDESAVEYFKKQVGNLKTVPKIIRWKPSRLETFAEGNVAAVGLSCGFIEPLEANALYIIVNSIRRLSRVLAKGKSDFSKYNEEMSYTIDDIADFILVHYTMSGRTDTKFWQDMKQNHTQLINDKINNPLNTMKNSVGGYSMFPDYMWLQLAISWGIDVKSKSVDDIFLDLSKKYYEYHENKHRTIANII
jgi:tryptophan halogenase